LYSLAITQLSVDQVEGLQIDLAQEIAPIKSRLGGALYALIVAFIAYVAPGHAIGVSGHAAGCAEWI
jgi:hypothetical protein